MDKAKRIVNIRHIVLTKMIFIIVILQVVMRLLQSPVVCLSHRLQLGLEILLYLVFRNTTDDGILWQETDVGEIVERREERELGELVIPVMKTNISYSSSALMMAKTSR